MIGVLVATWNYITGFVGMLFLIFLGVFLLVILLAIYEGIKAAPSYLKRFYAWASTKRVL